MYLKNYLNSFKPKKELGYTLLIEIFAVLIIIGLIFSFSSILKHQSQVISDGKSVEELKVTLLSGSEEYSQQFMENMRSFALTFIFGGILVIILSLFIFSGYNALIWYKLTQQKFNWKRYWRWNLVTLAIVILMIVFILIYGIILLTLNMILPQTTITLWFLKLLNILVVLAGLTIVFIIYHSFAQKYKVWESIGQAFHVIKAHWNKLWKTYLLSALTFVILELILSGIAQLTVKNTLGGSIMLVVNLFMFLVFVTWMRSYIVEAIKEPSK